MSGSADRWSRIWPSANTACSRTLGDASCSIDDSASTADAARNCPEQEDRLLPHPPVFQHAGERLNRARVAELAEAEGGLLPDLGARVLQCHDQRIENPGIAHLDQRPEGRLAHALVGVFQRLDQRIGRARIAFPRLPAVNVLVFLFVLVLVLVGLDVHLGLRSDPVADTPANAASDADRHAAGNALRHTTRQPCDTARDLRQRPGQRRHRYHHHAARNTTNAAAGSSGLIVSRLSDCVRFLRRASSAAA